jgi:hypothetical protein
MIDHSRAWPQRYIASFLIKAGSESAFIYFTYLLNCHCQLDYFENKREKQYNYKLDLALRTLAQSITDHQIHEKTEKEMVETRTKII